MSSRTYEIAGDSSQNENQNITEKNYLYFGEQNNNNTQKSNNVLKNTIEISPDTNRCRHYPRIDLNKKVKDCYEYPLSECKSMCTHTNKGFDGSLNSRLLNSRNSHLISSLESLDESSHYNTILRIDEDEHISNIYDSDVADGAVASNNKTSANDEHSSDAGSNNVYEEKEDTMSLLADTETNVNINLRMRESRSSLCEDKQQFHLKEALERRLSLPPDAGERIVNKLFDHHFNNYEELAKQEFIDSNCKKKSKKSKRVIKSGEILSTATREDNPKKLRKERCCCCCGIKAKFICGVLCVLIGILSTIWTPSEFLMRERLRMTPGLPAFDWWAEPPDDIYLRVYLFNYTNYEKFLSREESKLDLVEIGPVVFKEKLEHSNFTFHENGTLTYRAHRWVEFLPELNTHIDLNATVIVPNMPLLGFASYLHDVNMIIKNIFNILVKTHGAPIFVNITIYDYLFNFRDPLLETGQKLVPQIVPIANMGMLSTMYMQPIDTVTVYIGPKWGDENFFTIDRFNGDTRLPGFVHNPLCKESVVGSTEGILYRQRSTKNTTLLYWRKTLCKVMKLYFEDELVVNGIKAYKYSVPFTAYHRTHNESNPDCFAGKPPMFDGLSDISKCFYDFPMALSLPHFLGTDPKSIERINGLKADPALHRSYLIVEPMAGIPIESIARSQINLVVRKLSGFTRDVQLFSDTTIPMFWAEYSQVVLPDYVWALIITQLKYIPVIEVVMSAFFIIFGFYLTYSFVKKVLYPLCCLESFKQHKNLNNLARNAIMSYELEIKQTK